MPARRRAARVPSASDTHACRRLALLEAWFSSPSVDHDHRALDGQLAAARDLRLAAALDRRAAGRLDFRVHRFGLEIRLGLDRHGLLVALQRDAVTGHHDRVAVLILELDATIVVAQREAV